MEPPSPYRISLTNESGKRVGTALLRRAALATLSKHRMPAGTLSILLCSNERIQELNRDYRDIDEATDVLTFPAADPTIFAIKGNPILGDIAISVEYARAQAKLRNVPIETELAYLAIHGCLHLAGLDDVDEADRRKMQIAMAEMGEFLGLPPDPEWTSVLHAAVAFEEPA